MNIFKFICYNFIFIYEYILLLIFYLNSLIKKKFNKLEHKSKHKMNKDSRDDDKKSTQKTKDKLTHRKRQRESDKDSNQTHVRKSIRKNSYYREPINSTESKEDKILSELSELMKNTKHWDKIQREDIKEILIKNKEYIFGNYDRYYYKRFLEILKEPRLGVLQAEWFKDKKCLDIGSNDGTVTIMLAVCYQPKYIEGIDIDYRLIKSAVKNMKYVMRNNLSKDMLENFMECEKATKLDKDPVILNVNNNFANNLQSSEKDNEHRDLLNTNNDIIDNLQAKEFFLNESSKMKQILNKLNNMPKSFLINLGYHGNNNPLTKNDKLISIKNDENKYFPRNISFNQDNYIEEIKEEEKYDTIICLNTSKWIHLNYGDVGIKTLFYNVYKQLKPEGLFVFEPQCWKSYKKRKNLTPNILRNFSEINFKPEQFKSYLEKIYEYECIHISNPPSNAKKSYDRPIYVFKKK